MRGLDVAVDILVMAGRQAEPLRQPWIRIERGDTTGDQDRAGAKSSSRHPTHTHPQDASLTTPGKVDDLVKGRAPQPIPQPRPVRRRKPVHRPSGSEESDGEAVACVELQGGCRSTRI